MSSEFLPALVPVQLPNVAEVLRATPSGTPMAGAPTASFGSMVSEGLSQVDRGLQASQVDLQRLAQGDVGSVHELMVRLEESRLALQVVLQVRNRLLESYQELSRMQI
ncbi:MAG TPA: flagellar hook-basal body complex protein FliE [Anaerolineae bacterium]|nr:flagellar hook-basal body complex protein FliE [Anaerolineae bacterium]